MKYFFALFIFFTCIFCLSLSARPSSALNHQSNSRFFADSLIPHACAIDGKTVYFYPQGFISSVNVKSDTALPGQKLHLYFMGTDSNFSLEKQSDETYVIHSVAETFKSDFILGIHKDKVQQGSPVVLKSSKHADHTNNRWILSQNSDGTYQIKNVYSDMYLSLKNPEADADKNTVVQSIVPMNWNIVCYSDSHAIPWMSLIPGEKMLSEINIPGTHDTGTRLVDGLPEQASLCQCQQLTPEEQLNAGIRMFDLRCNTRDNPDDPLITHTFPCYDGIFDGMYLSEIFERTENFLKRNPSETVIFLISIGKDITNQGTHRQLEDIMANYISEKRIWAGTHVPMLKDVRGKIVLMRRFEVSGENPHGINESSFGFDMTAWKDGDTYSKSKEALKLTKGCSAWVQDHFNCPGKTKIKYFKSTLLQSSDPKKIPMNDFVLNYSSCTKSNPFSAAKYINKAVLSDNIILKGKRYGIIPMDYVSYPLINHIYMSNFTN